MEEFDPLLWPDAKNWDEQIYKKYLDQQTSMAVDIYAYGHEYLINIEIPGVTLEDIYINVSDQRNIIIEVTRSEQPLPPKAILKERRYGILQRTIHLPKDANVDQCTSELVDGILSLRFARRN